MGGTRRWEKYPKPICKTEVSLGSLGLVLLHLVSTSKTLIEIFIVLLIDYKVLPSLQKRC